MRIGRYAPGSVLQTGTSNVLLFLNFLHLDLGGSRVIYRDNIPLNQSPDLATHNKCLRFFVIALHFLNKL